MERGATLRILNERKLRIEGEHKLNAERTAVELVKFTAIGKDGKPTKKAKAGDVVKLVAEATIKPLDRVCFVRPNITLYTHGIVNGPYMIDESDGLVQPTYMYTVVEDIDFTKLSFFVKLYVSE